MCRTLLTVLYVLEIVAEERMDTKDTEKEELSVTGAVATHVRRGWGWPARAYHV